MPVLIKSLAQEANSRSVRTISTSLAGGHARLVCVPCMPLKLALAASPPPLSVVALGFAAVGGTAVRPSTAGRKLLVFFSGARECCLR